MWNLQEDIRCIVYTILQSFPSYQPNCRFAPLKSEREAENVSVALQQQEKRL